MLMICNLLMQIYSTMVTMGSLDMRYRLIDEVGNMGRYDTSKDRQKEMEDRITEDVIAACAIDRKHARSYKWE